METGHPNKLSHLKAVLVAPLLFILPVTASVASQPAVAARVGFSSESGIYQKFALGATRRSVVEVVGLPDARASGAIWIYHHSGTLQESSNAKNYDTLVIVFKQDRVVAMKLTDGNVLRDLMARRNLKVTGPAYADLLR